MKNTLIVAAVLGTMLVSPFVSTASASDVNLLDVSAKAGAAVSGTSVSVGAGVKVSARVAAAIKTAQGHADQEIARRITAMNALSARVNAMVKITDSDKTTLASQIQTQIAAMNSLQAQIATDAAANATSSLKADIQSITKSYRIFMLIIPQGAIDAAADRVLDVANLMTTLTGQLQARGGNATTLADMNAKIADANLQANTAISAIASLQPDNGDQTVMASNTATLKAARTKIQTGQQDLVAARKDAGTIAKALLVSNTSANASSTATVSTTASGTAQ